MRAIYYEQHGGPEVLQHGELPKPPVEDGKVLVRVEYAGVNPIDRRLRAGELTEYIPRFFPVVPGWDFSGTVDTVAGDVKDLAVGDPVMGLAFDWTAQYGTYAEYVPVSAQALCRRPAGISSKDAAALPLVSLTAWQALTGFGRLQRGQRVLIQAGAGGVGSVGIPMAKHLGAEVFTTASAANTDYVRSLGADHCIDYRNEDYADYIRHYAPEGLDLIVESLLTDETTRNAIWLCKDGGRVAYLNNEPPGMPEIRARGIEATFLHHSADGAMLSELVKLFGEGVLPLPPVEVLPLSQAQEAQRLSEAGHTRGKLVLNISA